MRRVGGRGAVTPTFEFSGMFARGKREKKMGRDTEREGEARKGAVTPLPLNSVACLRERQKPMISSLLSFNHLIRARG